MIHLISGKGGVGKSTVAASLAWGLAASGRKTLLVELGERSFFRHVFHNEIGAQPTVINTHLSVARWDGEACLREYLIHLLKIERVVRLFFDNKIMQALIQAAPALKELAVLGKATSGVRNYGPNFPYDEVVVDAYATGHFRALWRAPVGLAQAIPFGPMGEQSRAIVAALKNPELTRYYVVTIPEELPISEAIELARDIGTEMNQKAQIIVNHWLECPLNPEQLSRFAGHGFSDYLGVLLARQTQMEERLVPTQLKVLKLPWLFADTLTEKIRDLSTRLVVKTP